MTTTIRGLGVPFTFDGTGYPAPAFGLKLINDSIFTILSTIVGERVHRPTFGSYLTSFVFDPLSLATIYRIKSEIRRAVGAWEPRATITKIDVTIPLETTLLITISWIANGSLRGTTQLSIDVATTGA